MPRIPASYRSLPALLTVLPLLFFLFSPGAACAADISVTDDTGRTVRLREPAKRVISLYGAFNEILLSLGCGERIVARTAADAALPELAALPAIGTHMRPNQELILAHAPDIILQLRGRKEADLQTESLRRLGLPVLCFTLESFADMFRVTRLLGRLTGKEEEAGRLVAGWEETLRATARRHAGEKAVTVFYEVRYPNLLAAGRGSVVDEIIRTAGGTNVISDTAKIVRLNEEALILADPEVCVLQKGPMNPQPTPLEKRPHFKTLKCIATGRTLVVDETAYSRPGPRSIRACVELERFLHPGAPDAEEKR